MSAGATETQPGARPRRAPTQGAGAPPDNTTILWRAKWWILGLAVVAGALAYGVSRYAVDPTYSSSALIVVNAHTLSGGLSDAITASNDLASQYAQLADSAPVLARAARRLGSDGQGLGASISTGTVAAQNLIQVTAHGGDADLAKRRANAVAGAFVSYIRSQNAGQVASLESSVQARLSSSQVAIAQAQTAVSNAIDRALAESPTGSSISTSVVAAKESLLESLITQRQAILSDLAEGAVGAEPTVRIAAVAGTGSKVHLKPIVYAGIAALVTALVAGELFILAGRRRRH